MKGLLLKDIFILRKQFISLFPIFIFYGAFGAYTNQFNFLAAFLPFLFGMLVITSFSYDEAAKWQGYALSLPISRRRLVCSKSLLTILFFLAGLSCSSLFSLCMHPLLNKPGLQNTLVSCLASSGICLIFASIMLPVILYFGVEKGRIILFIIYVLPFAFLFLADKAGLLTPENLSFMKEADFLKYLAIGSIVTVLAFFFISILISIKIMEKKEY